MGTLGGKVSHRSFFKSRKCLQDSHMLQFIPIHMRLPLKFGGEVIESIQIAHVELNAFGQVGYGETPLSVGWAWPGALPFRHREEKMMAFCEKVASLYPVSGHDPIQIGYSFLAEQLPCILAEFNLENQTDMPYLAALICTSAFDIALHDAFGKFAQKQSFATYNERYMEHDLSWYFQDEMFSGNYPSRYFVKKLPSTLPVWHLVGGKDLLHEAERTGREPDDGYPVSLEKWIERDGLKCLKIKLTGRDAEWDFQRLMTVGEIAGDYGCEALSPDFNCMVQEPGYVNGILDRLKAVSPDTYAKVLYVEQPFPYDLEANQIDVHSCSSRKPLFMDESAHDWKLVRLGHSLGWTGVALKVCKTMTGAILSACWAKAHEMQLMVQDLTNPMLATIPHVLLAAHVGTLKGVECNAPQFYPQASLEMEKKHPGLYERRNGVVRLDTLSGNGFGY